MRPLNRMAALMTAPVCSRYLFPAALLVALATGASGYSGSLSSANGGIQGTGNWIINGPTTLSWIVTQNPDQTWHYSYTLSHPSGATSHFLLEVSQGFTNEDLVNPQGDFASTVIDDFSPGGSNPNMPGTLHAIKFDAALGLITNISFDSPRLPVWGDFYSKDGSAGGYGVNSAWNAGFTDPDSDPADPPSDGSVQNHILRPDTQVTPHGACCYPDGSCLVQTEVECQGTYQGNGTACDPNPCPPPPPPTGACCFADGSCVVLTAAECDFQGGQYQGNGTACDPNPCPPPPPPTGACCLPDGSCIVLTQEGCDEAGGSPWIAGATCDPNPCPPTSVQPASWGEIRMLFRGSQD